MGIKSLCQNSLTMEKDTVKLYAFLEVGAAGAVTSISGAGISSAVKEVADGQYTLTLDQGWQKFLGLKHEIIDNAVSGVASCQVLMDYATLQVDIKDRAPEILIQLLDYAGAAVNAAAGAVVAIEITVRRSSVDIG